MRMTATEYLAYAKTPACPFTLGESVLFCHNMIVSDKNGRLWVFGESKIFYPLHDQEKKV